MKHLLATATLLALTLAPALILAQSPPPIQLDYAATYGKGHYQALSWTPVKVAHGHTGKLAYRFESGPGAAISLDDNRPAVAIFAREVLAYDAKEVVLSIGPTLYAFVGTGSQGSQLRLGLSLGITFKPPGT